MNLLTRSFISSALALTLVGTALAGTLTGTVRNGTSGTPAAGQEVVLINLQSGMDSVGTFRADAQGRYRIEHPAIGAGPVLVRVQYRGVNYHTNVPPGQTNADIEIFESTRDARGLDFESRLIALQPSGNTLLIAEEFGVHNHTQPRVTVFNEQGNFEFQLPNGAELAEVSAAGPAGMPLVVGTIDRGKGRYAIAYAFRPGESMVRVSYRVPYDSNRAQLRLVSPYSVKNLLIVAPPTMEVQGENLVARGMEQGWNVYGRQDVTAGTPVLLNVSGTAPPPSAMAQQSQPDAAAAPVQGVTVASPRISQFQWILVVGFAAILTMGAFYLWKRPLPGGREIAASPVAEPATHKNHSAVSSGAPDSVGNILAAAQQEAQKRLEDIKDSLLRLEMRKQAGTIAPEDYARERNRIEQLLREYLGQ